MTRPREWPNAAKEARDQAAEHAQAALVALRPLIDRTPPDPAFTVASARAMFHTQQALRLLERAGAQTRPG